MPNPSSQPDKEPLDARIISSLSRAIGSDRTTHVTCQIRGDVVRLVGKVGTHAERNICGAVARTVAGSATVENRLKIGR